MNKLHATIPSVCFLLAACGPIEHRDEIPVPGPAPCPGEVVRAPVSDTGCPQAITVTSGLGALQVPYMVIAPSGMAFGSQIGLLRREFNSRAAEIGFSYCLARACVSEYRTAENVRYETQDFGGWTELTIGPTGGAPQVLGPNRVLRGGIMDPPSPNVICRLPPPLPPKVVTYTPPPPMLPPPPVEIPPHECKQPSFVRPAGTVVIEKLFPFHPLDTDKVNEEFADYVNNQLEADVDIVMQGWINEVAKECAAANPNGGCNPVLDPAPELERETGDSGSGSQLHMVLRLKLKSDVHGACRP